MWSKDEKAGLTTGFFYVSDSGSSGRKKPALLHRYKLES